MAFRASCEAKNSVSAIEAGILTIFEKMRESYLENRVKIVGGTICGSGKLTPATNTPVGKDR